MHRLLLAAGLLPFPALAQGATDALPRPRLVAVRTATPPRVDGDLDDAVWAAAPAVSDFMQRAPDVGRPASQRTEVRLLYDDRALYVAARMYDAAPDSIAASLFRRDGDGYSDWFFVMVDSYHDRRTAFSFEVSPRGVKGDRLRFNDVGEDRSWDAVWEADTHIDSLGWTAELRIPLSQLRFAASDDPQTWGLNFQRQIARREEAAYWSPTPAEAGGIVSRFGELAGLVLPRAPRRIEVAPYVASGLTRTPPSLADGGRDNPFYEGADPTLRAGADLRLGLPAGLTLAATLNPDFGQVEVDPAVVNLSAFETFFEERRPFFVEGTDVFAFGDSRAFNRYGVPTFFYSRRIGRPPQRALASDSVAFVDAPLQTTIAAAAKVSGQVGGWSVGLLDAVTTGETARYATPAGAVLTAPVEPLANHFVGRLRRTLAGGQTTVGLIGTTTHRDLSDEAFQLLLRSSAFLGGLDVEHAWDDRRWILSGYAAGSLVRGDTLAILAAQQSSARYFQRPDAEHLALDSSRTALGGHALALALVRAGGRHWVGSLEFEEVSPGFEVNDLGFFGRVDFRALSSFVAYRETRPGPSLLNYRVQTFSNHAWNFGGDPIFHSVGANTNVQLTSYWTLSANARVQPSFYNPTLTRGGPLARVPAQAAAGFGFGSDARQPFVAGASVGLRTDASGEYDRSLSVNTSWRPSAAVLFQANPFVGQQRDTDQFVRSVADAAATATFGRRYVIADIDGTFAGVEVRLDWTFSPTMSVQLFAQPYVESGRFHGFKELRAPRTFDFDVYGEDRGTIGLDEGTYTVDPDGAGPSAAFSFADPDYTFRSLRGSGVFRWEYRPGSTLFFVWQRVGEAFAPLGDFAFGRDFGEVLRQPAQDVFLAKLTYWIGR